MKSNKGFSLVELIVVIAIMAIIAAVAIPVYSSYISKAEDSNTVQLCADATHAAKLANAEFSTTAVYTVTVDGATITFTGTKGTDDEKAADAAAAAAQVETVSNNTQVVAAAGVVTITFEKALTTEGLTKAKEAMGITA